MNKENNNKSKIVLGIILFIIIIIYAIFVENSNEYNTEPKELYTSVIYKLK